MHVLTALEFFRQRSPISSYNMLEIICNDRLGRKIIVKCLEEDTVGDFKKVLGLQIGTPAEKLILKKGYMVFKDHITLRDYEINNGMSLELYYS